jgi:arylsulfatase A-like enzyme
VKLNKFFPFVALSALVTATFGTEIPNNGSVVRFSPTPMKDSVAKPRLQDSKMKWPAEPKRLALAADAPNILIILIDDVGFGIADTFGGEVRTPTLTKLANEGLRYNAEKGKGND